LKMTDLLSLLREKVDPAKIKCVSGRTGGEYHSPCPLCGGDDRFIVFPEQSGGEFCQKHGLRGTWSCPRGCGKGGDVLTFLMEVHGLSFKAACQELSLQPDNNTRAYRPLRQPSREAPGTVFVPREYKEPCDTWVAYATKLASEAHTALQKSSSILHWLAQRGLPDAAVRAYKLGYLEAEGKNTDCLYRARSAFALPEKFGKDGKPIRALRIPRGVTIPAFSADGRCCRIRIRRRDADLDKNNPKDPKYLLVPQPDAPWSVPMILRPDVTPDLATWVVVEAELDAMAVHHACGGRIGALSVLTVSGKPDVVAHRLLSRAVRILVALDFDADKDADGSNPGASAWPWWEKTYQQAQLWPVPEGKDPGEAFARGVDLRAWISAALPNSLPDAAGLLKNGIAVADGDSNNGQLGTDKKNKDVEVAAEDAGGSFRCWRVPRVRSLPEVVFPSERVRIMRDLLPAFRKNNVDDPDCLLPCPRTKPHPFWWGYLRDCVRCDGDPLCLVGLVKSDLFQEALHGN
jgi:hypothetical protein